jgi:hypothetical protein
MGDDLVPTGLSWSSKVLVLRLEPKQGLILPELASRPRRDATGKASRRH